MERLQAEKKERVAKYALEIAREAVYNTVFVAGRLIAGPFIAAPNISARLSKQKERRDEQLLPQIQAKRELAGESSATEKHEAVHDKMQRLQESIKKVINVAIPSIGVSALLMDREYQRKSDFLEQSICRVMHSGLQLKKIYQDNMAMEVLRMVSNQPVSVEFENTAKLMKDVKDVFQDSINDLILTFRDLSFRKDPSIVQFKNAVTSLNEDELFKFSEFLMLFEALSATKAVWMQTLAAVRGGQGQYAASAPGSPSDPGSPSCPEILRVQAVRVCRPVQGNRRCPFRALRDGLEVQEVRQVSDYKDMFRQQERVLKLRKESASLHNAAVALISAIDQLKPPVQPNILAEFDSHLKALPKSVDDMNISTISDLSKDVISDASSIHHQLHHGDDPLLTRPITYATLSSQDYKDMFRQQERVLKLRKVAIDGPSANPITVANLKTAEIWEIETLEKAHELTSRYGENNIMIFKEKRLIISISEIAIEESLVEEFDESVVDLAHVRSSLQTLSKECNVLLETWEYVKRTLVDVVEEIRRKDKRANKLKNHDIGNFDSERFSLDRLDKLSKQLNEVPKLRPHPVQGSAEFLERDDLLLEPDIQQQELLVAKTMHFEMQDRLANVRKEWREIAMVPNGLIDSCRQVQSILQEFENRKIAHDFQMQFPTMIEEKTMQMRAQNNEKSKRALQRINWRILHNFYFGERAVLPEINAIELHILLLREWELLREGYKLSDEKDIPMKTKFLLLARHWKRTGAVKELSEILAHGPKNVIKEFEQEEMEVSLHMLSMEVIHLRRQLNGEPEQKYDLQTERMHEDQKKRAKVLYLEKLQKHESMMTELKGDSRKKIDDISKQLDKAKERHIKDVHDTRIQQMDDSHSKDMELLRNKQELLAQTNNRMIEMAAMHERQSGQLNVQRALMKSTTFSGVLNQKAMDVLIKAGEAAFDSGLKLENVYRNELLLELRKLMDERKIVAEEFNYSMMKLKEATEELRKALEELLLEIRNTKNDDRREQLSRFRVTVTTLLFHLSKFVNRRIKLEVVMPIAESRSLFSFKKVETPAEAAHMLNEAAEKLFCEMKEFGCNLARQSLDLYLDHLE